MKIISFAWTSGALLAGRKTATCRDWNPDYARRFRAGDLIAAYDRSPRFKGKQIATLRLTHDATIGRWQDILTDPYEQEGFAWYDEQIVAGNAAAATAARRGLGIEGNTTIRDWLAGEPNWGQCVLRFELVDLLTRFTDEELREMAVQP